MDDEQLMQQQRQLASEGSITYERGLELVTVSGYIIWGGSSAVVYPDNTQLANRQKRTLIPSRLIVEAILEANDL